MKNPAETKMKTDMNIFTYLSNLELIKLLKVLLQLWFDQFQRVDLKFIDIYIFSHFFDLFLT